MAAGLPVRPDRAGPGGRERHLRRRHAAWRRAGHPRKGLTVEVGNTDAEGRLILADALTRAAELEPALTIDMATLTGAARVALGPQVIAVLHARGRPGRWRSRRPRAPASDPVWRMPLWDGYREAVEERHRRPQERSRRLGSGRVDDGGPVPAALRARQRAPGRTSTSSPGTPRRGRASRPAARPR